MFTSMQWAYDMGLSVYMCLSRKLTDALVMPVTGFYIPELADVIVKRNMMPETTLKIPLKGIMVKFNDMLCNLLLQLIIKFMVVIFLLGREWDNER